MAGNDTKYFLDLNMNIVAIQNDSLTIYTHDTTCGYPHESNIVDTLGIYKCIDIGEGFSQLELVESFFNKPFKGMYVQPVHTDHNISDSIEIKILLPNIDYTLKVDIVTEDSIYTTQKDDLYYKTQLPKNTSNIYCNITLIDLMNSSAFTSDGLYIGKLTLRSSIIYPSNSQSCYRDSNILEVIIPGINNRTFDYWYISGIYVRQIEGDLIMLGNMLYGSEKFWN